MSAIQDVLFKFMDTNDFTSLHRLLFMTGSNMCLREFIIFLKHNVIPTVIENVNENISKSVLISETFSTNIEVHTDEDNINIKIFGSDLPRFYTSKKNFYQLFQQNYENQVRTIILSCFPREIPPIIEIFDKNSKECIYIEREMDNIDSIMEKIMIHEVEEAFRNVDVASIISDLLN